MFSENKIWMGYNGKKCFLHPGMANRHGLISGATGTGKTVTLKVMAEGFSEMGVPVFLADVKGDISGMCVPGQDSPKMQERIQKLAIENFSYEKFPVRFWDVYGEKGLSVRTTISEMGPLLLARLLDLNDTQTGVLQLVFRIADDEGLLLLDMKDLRSMANYVGENAAEYLEEYGNISKQSIGAIQRKLLTLEDQGGDVFFGEPALDIQDWMVTEDGKGMMNILHCNKLIQTPVLYSTFLLWMLSELFEQLPEAGDLEKPKMVFFFDEASLLFNGASKVLLQKIEQTVRLIRSKGVGVYFITQSPSDIPDVVLAQLGNRVQHALRAYTPNEQKAVKAAAKAFRANPEFDTEEVITQLGIGEALVSFLDEGGVPQPVERAWILPPQSLMSEAAETIRMGVIQSDSLNSRYGQMVDRESAYELLTKRAAVEEKEAEMEAKRAEKQTVRRTTTTRSTGGRKRKSVTEKMVDRTISSFGGAVGRGLYRGLLGILKK